jgi:hypothetical protein
VKRNKIKMAITNEGVSKIDDAARFPMFFARALHHEQMIIVKIAVEERWVGVACSGGLGSSLRVKLARVARNVTSATLIR